jgi:hypothetical protein
MFSFLELSYLDLVAKLSLGERYVVGLPARLRLRQSNR